ncbi:MAG: ABC-F family ATP-binding cassette domain-containing protein [Clostridiaceae bacterium]|nr:ABC-F family ATP-binding cassette domain-containing protein [Clostridiaceae bacterium]
MIEISVSHVQKFFGDFQLLKDVDFDLYSGERVGLIGKNGAGKTTLFNIIADIGTGKARPGDPTLYDAGGISVRGDRRVGLIDQIPVYPEGFTVEDVLRTGFVRLDRMRGELAALEQRMATEQDPALLKRYGELSSRFEADGGYETEYTLEKVANGLDLDGDIRKRDFNLLSGGERSRANLARVILERSDILLLDEPTNHLDIDAVEWLGEYLQSYKGTVFVISHDRYFLDEVVTRIVEIENGVSEEYDGNYSYYAVEKERRYQEKLERYQRELAEKQKLEALARQYRAWATPTMMIRAKEIEHRVERLTVSDRPRRQKVIRARIDEASFFADDALSVRSVTKRFNDRTIVEKADFRIGGGERVAIYGPNGCGKTTLLRMIVDEYPCDEGSVRFGPQTKWIYLPQLVTFDNMERNVVDTLIYERGMTPQAARDALGQYLFVGEDVFKPLTALSGGERARLRLCMLMQDDVNMLILDEPTNHLDLAAREWLEGMLEGFGGVILFVSHDRYFVSRFATRVLEMNEGQLRDYKCGFEEYRARRRREKESAAAMAARAQKASRGENPPKSEEAREDGKEARRKKRRRESAENRSCELEREIVELDTRIEANASDYEKLAPLLKRKDEAESELLALYEELEE